MSTSPQTAGSGGKLDPVGLSNLFVVYIVWSSTYLAIRLAVQEGAGFPPFTMGLMRAALAAVVLLAWAKLRREQLKPTRSETVTLIVSGLLLWLGGNGLVTFAEQRTESGLAALLVAASPIWAAIIEAIVDRKWPSRSLVLALLAGFIGTGLLVVPELMSGVAADTVASLALVFAAIAWAGGSVFQARRPVSLNPGASSAYQMVFGALGFALVALLMGEPRPTPTPQAWWAFGYLVVVGSIFTFTAYVTALRRLPTQIVMTYAYVNPVLAVLLGSLVLNEKITPWIIFGSLFVLIGVAGVFQERRKRQQNATKA
ncbi:MAG: EamA family transporter [Anaerolineales bacterium]|nr:EamA family transporter [Anaerolineales bacterium]MCW5855534.1 EamA family transporter [Anaerolineales bacterium]